jgi:hypothetical protein
MSGLLKTLLVSSSIALIYTAGVPCASASLIDWTFSGVTFNDGCAASGGFTMDTVAGHVVPSSIAIWTTGSGGNNAVTGYHYAIDDYSSSGTQSLFLYASYANQNIFSMTFDRPLTTYGTTAYFHPTSTSWEGFIGGPTRFVTSGAVTSPGIPEIEVLGSGQNIADGDSTPSVTDGTDFGSVGQGAAAVSHKFRVSNTGTAALTAYGLTVPEGFSVTDPLSIIIQIGSYDDFTVTLSTGAAGTFAGDISFANYDEDGGDGVENPFNFRITGTVVPEPGTCAMLLAALGLSGFFGRRRKQGIASPGSQSA